MCVGSHATWPARGSRGRRYFAIAAASQLTLPPAVGRLRVQVAEVSHDAKWFVRFFGDCGGPVSPVR